MKTEKARTVVIELGNEPISCLVHPDGSYSIAASQLADYFLVPQKNAARDFKAMLPEGFQYLKQSTDLNPRKIPVLDLTSVGLVAVELACKEKCNQETKQKAKAYLVACQAETIERRIDKALNIQRTEEERNERFKLRFESKLTRRSYTDILKELLIKQYGEDTYKELSRQGYFRDVTVKVNQYLFGVDHFNCDRDNMTDDQLVDIEQFEKLLARRARRYPHNTAEQLLQWMLENF